MVNEPVEIEISKDKNLPTPSIEFYNMIEELAKSIDKPRELYRNVVEKGRSEGFTDETIDILIGTYLKGRVHRNTLANYRKEFLKLPEMHKNVQIDSKKVIEDSYNTTPDSNITEPPSEDDDENPPPVTSLSLNQQQQTLSPENQEFKTFREKGEIQHREIKEKIIEPFWVDFYVKIGTGGINFTLLIDAIKKRVIEFHRK